MKKKILVFGASNSKNSINHEFAKYAASQIENAEINLVDLNDYEMPIFGVDREKEGHPKLAYDFLDNIKKADGMIISFAEHNGNYTTAFKNISDWISRIELKSYADKPVLLLATSPGGGGAKSVLGVANKEFAMRGANIAGSFSLPQFYNSFSENEEILDADLRTEFLKNIYQFKTKLNSVSELSFN